MPRKPRVEAAGGLQHAWNRGNRRRPIFIDDDDRRLFLRLFQASVVKHQWIPLSYCLMGNHFHLVVETPVPTLGNGMRDLEGRYARLFNERHAPGAGHVYKERYGNRLATSDEQFAQLLRYVANNPVRANLCREPEDWLWSSHAALLQGERSSLVRTDRVEELLEAFGGPSGSRYASLFGARSPLHKLPPDLSPWDMRPTLEQLLDEADDLQGAVYRARRHGYRTADVAAALDISEVTLWRRMKGTVPVPLR
jgi:REP element-mobilizing transposase RayT